MGRRTAAFAAMAALLFASVPAPAQAPAWSAEPWLADLTSARTAFETKYANLDWLLTEREVDLDSLFGRARTALINARSDSEAVAIFNRLVQRVGDGHVEIAWPRPPAGPPLVGAPAPPAPPPSAEGFCRAQGYSPPSNAPGLAPALTGYAPIASGDLLPAGTIRAGGSRIGILRIPVFDPHASLSLCVESAAALGLPVDRPCDGQCADRLITEAYRRLGLAMQDRLARLRAAGATILVVDITGNGGGSEWTEAAARMLSRRPLRSAPLGFVRGPHWERQWSELAGRLRGFASEASPADRTRLLAWASQADSALTEARRRCPPTGDPSCPWLGRAGFATGLVGTAPSGSFEGKDWAVHVFNPAQHSYRDGAWDGAVIVLTDQETWSAAEQFAALLQDNRAALIVGARTGGAGCGHTWGGTPTVLPNSGATLRLPDCARFRADGSNEVRGIIPDLLLAWRANDGRTFRARLLEAALPEAVNRARALHRRGSR
ncbi:S41 family peptidase [Allosphingosinicella sp.]|uniref:S41 family peptidase n=1 Tax=Allosphingosinicella sp. TaxID=2823234 RepID=UPI002F0606A3